MKSSRFGFRQVFAPTVWEALERLQGLPEATFNEQVAAAGLDPRSDLRFADLSDVDLSFSDLRGYDLTGADLRNSVGIQVRWDDSTQLAGAELGGSIFALRYRLASFFSSNETALEILRKVSIRDTNDKIIWAADNLANEKTREVALNVTQALFYASKDSFLRSQLLDFLSPRMRHDGDLKDLLLSSIAMADKPIVARAALAIFERYDMAHDLTVRRSAFALLKSTSLNIRAVALEFLIRTYPTAPERERIRALALKERGYLSRLFVAGLAQQMGPVYDFVARNPFSGDTFEIDEKIPISQIRLMARRYLNTPDLIGRSRYISRRKDGSDFSEAAMEEAMSEIREMIADMNRQFASFQITSQKSDISESALVR